METFTALKLLHGVSTLLLFVSAIALLVVVIRRWRAGDKNLSGGVVQRPWSYVWALMGLCLLALPVSGWFFGASGRLAVEPDMAAGGQLFVPARQPELAVAGGAP